MGKKFTTITELKLDPLEPLPLNSSSGQVELTLNFFSDSWIGKEVRFIENGKEIAKGKIVKESKNENRVDTYTIEIVSIGESDEQ